MLRLLSAENLLFRSVMASDACRLYYMHLGYTTSVWDFHLLVQRGLQSLLAAYLLSSEGSECGNAETAAGARAAAEQWRSLLLQEIDLIGVLGAAASLLPDCKA